MTFDSLVNEGEYFPAFYLDDILPTQLRNGLLKEWAAKERAGESTPRQALRDLSGPYLDARAALRDDADKYNATEDARAVAAQAVTVRKAAHAAGDENDDEGDSPDFTAAADPAPGAAWVGDDSPEGEWRLALASWHDRLLRALGYTPVPGLRNARSQTATVAVPVAHSEDHLVVLTGGYATTADHVRGGGKRDTDGAAGRLPAPVRLGSGKTLTTVNDLAAWLFTTDNAPRYALLLFGGVMILADKENFGRGRYLAVSLDIALPRKGAKGAEAGEIDLIAALFSAEALRPKGDGQEDEVARLVTASRDHSVGVTGELRKGLQASVQLIANEVLNRVREQGVRTEDLAEWLPDAIKEPGDLPRLLTVESLRYLYRILFLLYAEARPELDILPMKSEEYVTGYSVSRLRELVVHERLTDSRSHTGHHLHDSLALLFEKVFTGFPVAPTVSTRAAAAAPTVSTEESVELIADDGQAGLRIEALRSQLFDPESIRLVGRKVPARHHSRSPSAAAERGELDLRLRNSVLHKVLRHLTVIEGRGRGRGGFISYANLSINHLGSVYEGLMSYTGRIATQQLYEVAKRGDAEGGSWLINKDQAASGRYPDEPGNSVFVKRVVDRETGEVEPATYPVGTYVYRLSGRERQTSASYYTPESLTQATVEQALRFRLHPEGTVDPKHPGNSPVSAAEVLKWRVCEPALGSGAFLNEAVNQLAELYLRLAERDNGKDIDPGAYQREFQKAKAYIALHNAYGVDLNETAVELAEISLWLNTMYPGMRAPWYGLHLHRGNSLIGASRKIYPGNRLHEGRWLKASEPATPRILPLGQSLPGQAVHQFLLPALGWGSVVDDVSVTKPKKDAEDQTKESKVAGVKAPWLEPEVIEAMTKWRSRIRTAPKGGGGTATTAAAVGGGGLAERAADGQETFDLGLMIWEQDALGAGQPSVGTRGKRAVDQARRTDAQREDKAEAAQVGRLMALAQRVEYLWQLVIKRLELSELEIARTVGVWGVDGDAAAPGAAAVMDRDAVRAALRAEGSPYWRLRQLMDAWCALWFWPLEEVGLLDGSDREHYFDGDVDRTSIKKGYGRRRTALKSLDDWIEFAEAVVGRVDVDSGKQEVSFFEVGEVTGLRQLDEAERELDEQMIEATAWADPLDLGDLFPWYETAYRIAVERGFFHWELNFAHIFAEGGFDLMVGNPPWVKQEWKESGVLAEFEPWFELSEQPGTEVWAERKGIVLAEAKARSAFLDELAGSAALSRFLGSVDTYPELVGTQPDLYRAFMLQAWRAIGERGIAGLVHPSTHLTGAKDGLLRRSAYRHLRLHADFANELYLFAKPVMNDTRFSVNIYGMAREVNFQHASWLYHPQVLLQSIRNIDFGPPPVIKRWDSAKDRYTWDLRPHSARILTVDRSVLRGWRALANDENAPPVEETRMLFPVTTFEESAISSLARWPYRIANTNRQISRGFDEKNDKGPSGVGYFVKSPGHADSWSDVIIQGSFIGVATPYGKQPPLDGSKTMRDYNRWDHVNLNAAAIPNTNYRRSTSISRFNAKQDKWIDQARLDQLRNYPAATAAAESDIRGASGDYPPREMRVAVDRLLTDASKRPYSQFFRLAWREMNRPKNERVLQAAIIPPGPTHVHAVRSMALESNEKTVLAAGFFSTIPAEYLLRITNRVHMDVSDVDAFPVPLSVHPLAPALELRTLRLNCQTSAYSALWSELYSPAWENEIWANRWQGLPSIETTGDSVWNSSIPLRSERSRRAAIVELDALVAVWLGINADSLIAMYHSRFPVLRQYEEKMWFDATGRRISYAPHARGYSQPARAWEQLTSHGDFPHVATVPDGYTGPLYRADRETEMRAAHAEFTRRMRAVGWEPGQTSQTGLSVAADKFDVVVGSTEAPSTGSESES